MRYWVQVEQKPGTLYALMKHFCGRGSVSFEGYLRETKLDQLTDAVDREEGELIRACLAPKLDFIQISLNDTTIPQIWEIICEKDYLGDGRRIIHVQIAVDAKLVFGA